MSGPFFFPFAQNPLFLIPQVINYDLLIQEPYPGIGFLPTSAGGLYAEIRDVNNCLWFVQNAMWNPDTMQWEQDSPANPILPAYALELCADGSLNYNIAAASGAINTALTWQTVWTLDANGNMTVEPAIATADTQIAEMVDPTWDGGVGAKMIGRQENVTDTSSASSSAIDQLNVDGVTKWEVRKDGTLVVGIIPASLVPGVITDVVGVSPVSVVIAHNTASISLEHGDYVDLTSAQTIAGVKTFTDPNGILFGTTTGSEGSISGNATAQAMGYGAQFATTPFVWQAEATQAAIIAISTANDAENPSGLSLYYDSGLTPGDTYNPTLRFSVDATGHISTGSILASTLAGEMEGADGITVSFDSGTDKVKIDGAGLLSSIISTNGSLLVSITDQVADIITVTGGSGESKMSVGTLVAAGSSFTQTLSITLPGSGTWNLLAQVGGDVASDNSMSITGSGGNTQWNTGVSTGSGFKFLTNAGTANGGADVTATFVCTGQNSNGYQALPYLLAVAE